jgi:hypothetical protein
MKPSSDLLSAIAENLDLLMQVSVRGRLIVPRLYAAARARQSGEPLTLLFARTLTTAVREGDFVLINTGWIVPGFDNWGESDGPLGAAVLGRTLALGVRARPLILVEPSIVPLMERVCWAAGVVPLNEEQLRSHSPAVNRAVGVSAFPIDPADADRESTRLVDTLRPTAIVAIEKNGPSRGGRFHMLRGYDRTDHTAKADRIFAEARSRRVPTLAIGDLGNELGMGLLEDVVHELLPVSRTCHCACGSGSADATPSDVVLVAENSNLGAYAGSACLAAALGRGDLVHDPRSEQKMLEAAAGAGALDGSGALPVPAVDGAPLSAMVAAVTLVRDTVQVALEEREHEPFYFGLE